MAGLNLADMGEEAQNLPARSGERGDGLAVVERGSFDVCSGQRVKTSEGGKASNG
jgi:hypothetical protein